MRRTAALLDDDVDDDCELEDKKERGALEFLNIEGDGILDSMYEVLWTKQDDSVHSVGDVVVPDTVVFKFNKPTGWYFTKISSKTKVARLHKKKPSALRVGLILKHFENSSASNCSDIVAYFISQVAEGHKSSRIFYLTRSELKDWLEKRKNKNGILQGFVDPKPSTSSQYNNCLVRCTWNQSVCLVERRTNVHALTNTKKASRYDRAETFEGDFRNSIEYPLTSAKLLEHTRRVCSSIVDHFFNIACGKVGIANMVINFKFDADTRLHLLWCESLRLDVKKHPITHIALAPAPSQIGGCVQTFSLANKLKLPSKSEQGQEFAECPFCKKEFSVGDMVEVSYHTLLSTYDEIKLHGLGESASLTRLRKKWFKKKPSFDSKNMKRETTVPIDSQCFTIPMNPDQGLLAHLDERLFLEPPDGPMVALSKAIDEWDDRQARNKEKEEVIVPKVTQASQRSCVDVPGIPWFVKQLHPHITVRDWVHVRDRDDFLGLKTNSCGFCFLGLTHGLTTEDTLKRHHMNITKKPHIESGNELPLAVTRRRRHLGSDDRRQRATGLSRLIVPCIVTVNESTTEPPTIESLWGRNRITDRPSMLSSMTGQQNTVEAIDVSTRGGKQQPASGSGSGSGDGTTSKVLSGYVNLFLPFFTYQGCYLRLWYGA